MDGFDRQVLAMKLFMFYVGGDCGNSNVELHDMRFSVGASAEDCHEDLRRQWWGNPDSLHLDCWGAVEQADGFDVTVTDRPHGDASDRLFFVNLGGYDPREFSELHRNVLLVAPDAKAATAKALQQIRGWSAPHRDNVFEIEKAIDVTAFLQGRGQYLTLTQATEAKPFTFVCEYLPLSPKRG
jgi:hypothetical protein